MPQTHTAHRARRSVIGVSVAAILGSLLTVPAAAQAASEPELPSGPLITTGTTWKYLDTNEDPADGHDNLRIWTTPDYDDASWKSAPSSFGVKNNKLESVGGYLPTTKLEHYIDGVSSPTIPTYFFRTDFTLEPGVAEQIDRLIG